MDTNRIPKQALQYKPKWRSNRGRPRRDGGTNFILRIKKQETRLILHEHDEDDVLQSSYIIYLIGNSYFFARVEFSRQTQWRKLSSKKWRVQSDMVYRRFRTTCYLNHHPDRNSEFLWSVDICLSHGTASRPRKRLPSYFFVTSEGRCSSHAKMFRSVN
jgi:hypothetical protein